MSNQKPNINILNSKYNNMFRQSKIEQLQQKTKQTSKKGCDLFCFRQCSDKYDELILRKQGNWKGMQKVSLKKIHQQIKNDMINKSMIKSSSQKILYQNNPQRKIQGGLTYRTRQQQNSLQMDENNYDNELFKKKKDIQVELESLNSKTFKLNYKYEQKISQLKQIQYEIINRKKDYYNHSLTAMSRQQCS